VTALSDLLAFLKGKGLTAAQAAGVAGNVQIESAFNPKAFNEKEGAIGFAQWEGGRRTALQRFAASLGRSETDPDAQRQFMWHELTGSESSALAALKATSTPAEAAAVFDQKYERSSGGARKARIDAANAIASGGVWKGTLEQPGLGDVIGSALDSLNPLSGWAKDANTIGLKILGGATAAALVIVGAVHTVKS